jgi:hypothetical protein
MQEQKTVESWKLSGASTYSTAVDPRPITKYTYYVNHSQHAVVGRSLMEIADEIFIKCHKSTVDIISTETDIDARVLLHKGTWSKMYSYSGGNLLITVPADARITSGVLTVDLFINNTKEKTQLCQIVGENICIMRDCLLCAESFDNWGCLTPLYKTIVVLVIMALVLLAIIAIPVMAYLLYASVWFLMMPFKLVYWGAKAFANSKFTKDVKNTAGKSSDIKNYFFQPIGGDAMGKIAMVGFLFAFTFTAGNMPFAKAQCAGPLSVTAIDLTSCVTVSGITQCNVELDIDVSLSVIGSSMCIAFVNSSNPSQIVGQAQITYVSLRKLVTLDFLYATGAYNAVYQEVARCANDAHVEPGNPCPSALTSGGTPGPGCVGGEVNRASDPTVQGQITDTNVQNYPGEAFCLIQPNTLSGCAGFTFCDYSEWALVTNTTDFRRADVYNFAQFITVPEFQITVTDINGNTQTADTTLGSAPITVGNFTFTSVSTLTSLPTIFAPNKLVWLYDNVTFWLAPAQDQGAPLKGAIGDIQGNVGSFGTAAQNAFDFDGDIAQQVVSNGITTYNFISPGIRTLGVVGQELPSLFEGDTWSVVDSTLDPITDTETGPSYMTSEATQSSTVVFNIATSQNISFEVFVSTVCPVIASINAASGCFQCSAGFEVNFTASSSCQAGPAFVTLVNAPYMILSTPNILLTTEEKHFMITGSTSQATNNFCLNISSATSKKSDQKCFQFTATLINDVPTTNVTYQRANCTLCEYPGFNGGGASGALSDFFKTIGTFFGRVFQGLGNWWEYLIFGVVVFIGIILFIYLLPYIIKLIKWAFSSYRTAGTYPLNRYRQFRSSRSKQSDGQDIPLQTTTYRPSGQSTYADSLRQRFRF